MGTHMAQLFICHNSKDIDKITTDLIDPLKAKGFSIWTYQENQEPGNPYQEKADKAIENCLAFIYVMTSRSVKSTECDREIDVVRFLNRDLKNQGKPEKKILPVLLEGDNTIVPGWIRNTKTEYADLVQNPNDALRSLISEIDKVYINYGERLPPEPDPERKSLKTLFNNFKTMFQARYVRITCSVVIGLLAVVIGLFVILRGTEQSCEAGTMLTMAVASESVGYMKDLIAAFRELEPNAQITIIEEVFIQGVSKRVSSGSAAEFIMNPDGDFRPTMYAPSVIHWIEIVNHWDRQYNSSSDELYEVFQDHTASAWVVMAIWESRLRMFVDRFQRTPSTLTDFITLLEYPDDVFGEGKGILTDHPDPRQSSTGLSALYLEYWVLSQLQELNAIDMSDDGLLQRMQSLQARMTSNFAINIGNADKTIVEQLADEDGPSILNFRFFEENDVYNVNQSRLDKFGTETDLLVPIYLQDGSFLHTHPIAIYRGADKCQREIAEKFIRFIMEEPQQSRIASEGFRIQRDQTNVFPERMGLTNQRPPGDYLLEQTPLTKEVATPAADILIAMQAKWLGPEDFDYIILLDRSGSMNVNLDTTPLINVFSTAKNAIIQLISRLPDEVSVQLIDFYVVLYQREFTTNLPQLSQELIQLQPGPTIGPDAYTNLYGALFTGLQSGAMRWSQVKRPIRIILFSDGNHTDANTTRGSVDREILRIIQDHIPVVLIPVGYAHSGLSETEKELRDLSGFAGSFGATVATANEGNVQAVFDDLLRRLSIKVED
jgi:hypothetical protein